MSVLPIVRWPDARLMQACDPVGPVTAQISALAADMLETMYAAPGRGLAGPQVGAMLRIFVMDVGWKEGRPEPVVCLDPVLIEVGAERVSNSETCLSIPGVSAEISRPAQVRMAWTGLDGARREEVFTGFAAACVQHEMDHLDGIVTFDHLDADTRAALEAEVAT